LEAQIEHTLEANQVQGAVRGEVGQAIGGGLGTEALVGIELGVSVTLTSRLSAADRPRVRATTVAASVLKTIRPSGRNGFSCGPGAAAMRRASRRRRAAREYKLNIASHLLESCGTFPPDRARLAASPAPTRSTVNDAHTGCYLNFGMTLSVSSRIELMTRS
jgi:hypothetical protein